ncbi:RNA polymerase II transcription mediator complex subunit 9 domain-containing protein [Hirsutella rhossiliensis]|uniref:Mediator of RNA polymerase II transcription subunit 9 n=1 Tax=Hirsutella rhossiliensis TaxID=111463 RepID=A0A9P8N1Z8_9HYPO|nr:RNA polymerase II transcription mediator complex subunit 9 domain-containing protein [Hirsutella rhossiliensis]KAH0965415.1 RNA polymerase II transcription mediator complex subunit 9 domain-containing protein [Hirsutella rhossiliensis]
MATRQQHPLALPPTLSPDDLDTLSELSIVLAKVRAGIQSSTGIATGTGVMPGPGPAATNGQQLSFKDVPGATDGLKHKLQHARAQVRALPDMDRSIDEQRLEISELEARIQQQRALLDRLRDAGVSFAKDDGAAGDVKMGM